MNATIILTSPHNTPFDFTIGIGERPGNKECSFQVTGNDPGTGFKKTCVYQIKDREHSSYLNLFEKLANDFGLRLPQNRQPEMERSFIAPYHLLLSKNLVPEMLYGYGDPAVLRVDQDENETWYYLVSTSNDAPDSFPISRSKDLEKWEFVGFVFPKGNKPAWASDGEFTSDYWAPEMHLVQNEFRIYFVAREKNTLELCIGMARSSKPEGPFIADTVPILKGNNIDPHVFVEDDHDTFLYWKEDNNALWPDRLIALLYKNPGLITLLFTDTKDQVTASFMVTLWPWIQTLKPMEAFLVEQVFIETVTASFSCFKRRLSDLTNDRVDDVQQEILSLIEIMRTPVYVQKLSADGSQLVGNKMLIIENDQPWESHLVEGMWVTKHHNKYYLFYSGNDFSTDQYGIGVAIADSASGPFKKMPVPIFKSTKEWWAPGHPSVAIGPDGRHYLFMHAYFPHKAGYKEFRALLTVPIKFEEDRVIV